MSDDSIVKKNASRLSVCVVTGTRAEYSLLRNLIHKLNEDSFFELYLLVTGTHLVKRFGYTINEIISDGIPIAKQIDIDLNSDRPTDISNSTAKGLQEFAKAYDEIHPDLILLLGDRYELMSSVLPACFARIPIAHIHGGELTEGLIDEAIRHSITKFSHLHFVAAEEYRRRVIQLGEDPSRVFNVGGMGIDSINSIDLLSKSEVEMSLGLKLLSKSLLITYHPVTLDDEDSLRPMNEMLEALKRVQDTTLIFTMPNADPGNNVIFKLITNFVREKPNSYAFTSLGQKRYLSLLQYIDGVVGNSSSGLLEVPFFKKATINIGDRQKGRLQAHSVINCKPDFDSIAQALNKIYSPTFCMRLSEVESPYGDQGASSKIIRILKSINFRSLIKKSFFDM
ncbi:UDP-N-acetylglucosamine 2-epimerase [Prochlorococcus sp. MIT 1307]|uniref:UDP-N-acetylglucosamine 2-epimerase n=1 Tax=Prochlorococcus sp. MIT 1307 TaxID=3096219 RepID=UPI002A750BB8|nr:UDP-N-acetylglucosamine 2-epimerase [Prochlorococcus sp. MIT 1307]